MGLLNMTRHLLIYWVYEQNKTKKRKDGERVNRSALLVEHAHLSFPTIGVYYSLPMIPTLETIPLSFICFRVMQAIPQDSCVSVMICDIEELLSFHNSVSCCDWSLFLSIIYLSSNYHLYHPSISSSYLCVYCLSIYIHT